MGSLGYSQINATTEDGKKVILNEDGSWQYSEKIASEDREEITADYYVNKIVDDMTDKVYYTPSENLICQVSGSSRGFSIRYSIEGKSDKSIKVSQLIVQAVGLECIENSKLLILFEDGSKMNLSSWNKFNCEGNAYFSLTPSQIKILSSKKIKKMRIENGRNHKSHTHEMIDGEGSYLILTAKAVKDKIIKLKE